MRKVLLILLGIKICLYSPTSLADSRIDFVKEFMSTQLLSNAENFTRLEKLKYISKEYFISNNIDPFFVQLNTYAIDKYEIVGKSRDFVDVKIINNACIKAGNCWGDHVLKLRVVRQDDGYALLPYGYKKGSQYIPYWWQSIKGKY